MPSHHLIRQYADLFEVEKEWRWSGAHYQRTAQDWLANFDAHREEIDDVLRPVYGSDTNLWMRRWRWFFLSRPQDCSATPAAANGAEVKPAHDEVLFCYGPGSAAHQVAKSGPLRCVRATASSSPAGARGAPAVS